MMNHPQSLDAVVAYLTQHPLVLCRAHGCLPTKRRFVKLDDAGRIWWEWETGERSFTPTRCPGGITISFTGAGFAVTAFDRTTTFDYLPD